MDVLDGESDGVLVWEHAGLRRRRDPTIDGRLVTGPARRSGEAVVVAA